MFVGSGRRWLSRLFLLVFTPLLLAGCATGEALPYDGDGGGGDLRRSDVSQVLDSWTDGPSVTEGGEDAADAAVDAAADAAVDAAADAALDAAIDAGLCQGPAGCDDGLACTDDICLEAGTCVNLLKPGRCLIAGVCYNDGAASPQNACQVCDTKVSTSALQAKADGTPCAADSFSCTADSCQSGLCAHPVSPVSCLISGACYTSGQTNPTGACSFCKPAASQSAWTPVSYQGCCVGATVVFCDSGTLQGLDCAANPSCGWDASFGYYDCGTSGGADPSGTNPKNCL